MATSIAKETVLELAEERAEVLVSLFMPTQRGGSETRQDPIRFKNLVGEARQALLERGLSSREADALTEPAHKLLDDTLFWRHQSDGLAAYLSPAGLRTCRLPFRFRERVVVGERFLLKPLIQLLAYNGHFHVLALDLHGVRLLEGSMFGVAEIEMENVPVSLEHAVEKRDSQPGLQARTISSGRRGGSSATMFHGTGDEVSREKEALEGFLRQVDAGIVERLGHGTTPLVLAGVDYVTSDYRALSRYPHLLEQTVSGSPRGVSDEHLRDQAWNLVRPCFEQVEARALEQYAALAGTGKTSTTLESIVTAAAEGRVERLLLSRDGEAWGCYDPVRREVTVTEPGVKDSVDLLDRAACQTLRDGGEVLVLSANRMPEQTLAAAVLRY